MSMQTLAAVVLTVLACAFGQAATAGEHVLEFKLVVKAIDVKSLEAPTSKGSPLR